MSPLLDWLFPESDYDWRQRARDEERERVRAVYKAPHNVGFPLETSY
jgi:hypothetical protein